MSISNLFPNSSNANMPALLPLYLTSIAPFSDSMHRKLPLERAVEKLATCLGACASVFSRSRFPGEKPRSVAIFDSAKCVRVRRLTRSYAQEVVGETLDLHGAGAAIFFSDTEHTKLTCDPSLSLWMEKRSVSEIAILHLSKGKRDRDVIELHFSEPLPKAKKLAIVALAECLARIYATRRLGIIVEATSRQNTPPRSVVGLDDMLILSAENPAGLTRMEYRVCALVGRGLAKKTVASELAISINTVRTHLRRIYSKTGYSNYYELSHRLVSLSERIGMHFDTQQRA